MTITNNTITGNSIDNSGGGVYLLCNDNGIANVYNNIIWGNDGSVGADIYLDGTGIFRGYNNCYQAVGGSWTNSRT